MFEGRVFSSTLKCLYYWYTGFWVVFSWGRLWKVICCVKPWHALWGTKQAERAVGVARAACFEPLARRIRQRWCLSPVCLSAVCFLSASCLSVVCLFVCLFSFSFHSTHTLSLHLSLDSSWIPLTLLWRFYLDYDQENRLFLDRNSSKPLFYPYLGTKSGLQSIKSHISWS